MSESDRNESSMDTGKLGQDYSWLGEMLLPIYEKLEEEKAGLAAALRAVEDRKSKVLTLSAQYDGLLDLAHKWGISPKDVEVYCRSAQMQKALEAARQAEAPGKRRVGNYELMVIVGRAIRKANRPLSIEEVMDVIERENIYLPGKEPRKNMLAYLSRSPIIKSPKKGWYFYDPDLLKVAEQMVRDGGGVMEDEEGES